MTFKLFISIGTCVALLMPLGAQATPITNIAISGTGSYTIYALPSGQTAGTLLLQPSTQGAVEDILMNNNTVGNVQLGSHSAPGLQTNMTITFDGGSQATFSSLLKGDWTASNNALVHNYITAAGNSVLMTLTQAQLDTATNYFLNIPLPGNIYAWQLASNPTIAAIDLVNGHIIVGQDGLPSPQVSLYLTTLFGVQAPIESLASEVVKVNYNGSNQYLYSFKGTLNDYAAQDGFSYKERYTAQTIPEPTTMLLLGVGFMGLGYMRRHNKRD